MSGTEWGLLLGVVGLVLTIFFGLRAVKSRSQRQRTGDSSVSIQSGRDTNVDR